VEISVVFIRISARKKPAKWLLKKSAKYAPVAQLVESRSSKKTRSDLTSRQEA